MIASVDLRLMIDLLKRTRRDLEFITRMTGDYPGERGMNLVDQELTLMSVKILAITGALEEVRRQAIEFEKNPERITPQGVQGGLPWD